MIPMLVLLDIAPLPETPTFPSLAAPGERGRSCRVPCREYRSVDVNHILKFLKCHRNTSCFMSLDPSNTDSDSLVKKCSKGICCWWTLNTFFLLSIYCTDTLLAIYELFSPQISHKIFKQSEIFAPLNKISIVCFEPDSKCLRRFVTRTFWKLKKQ